MCRASSVCCPSGKELRPFGSHSSPQVPVLLTGRVLGSSVPTCPPGASCNGEPLSGEPLRLPLGVTTEGLKLAGGALVTEAACLATATSECK